MSRMNSEGVCLSREIIRERDQMRNENAAVFVDAFLYRAFDPTTVIT
jgi:hypothetical protein